MGRSSWTCPECAGMLEPHCEPRISRMSCRWLECPVCWALVNTETKKVIPYEPKK